MKLTMGRKLGLGFGAIIVLMIINTIIGQLKVTELNVVQGRITELRFPTLVAGRDMINGVNHSLAALRGYMILGGDEKKAKLFKSERAKAWQELDGALAKFSVFSENWTDPENIEFLDKIKLELIAFRKAQQEIEDIPIAF